MYTAQERDELLEKITEYLRCDDEFEGLVRMGSGAEGFRDIYSDIDLMAGCRNVAAAGEKLYDFFTGLGAVYIDRRRWTDTVLGYSAYWENGLSVDLSFMPTAEIPVQSDRISIVFSKSDAFTQQIQAGLDAYQPKMIDNSVHHPFFFALRRCEIAVARGEYIYADMALAEGRTILLRIEAAREGNRRSEPKRFNELDASFLKALEGSYPSGLNRESLCRAKENLLSLYGQTVVKCDFLTFDERQLKLIGCFE